MRKPVLVAALLTVSLASAKVFVDLVPRWRTAAARRLYEEFDCTRTQPVPVRLNVNLLQNPGLEGPCGWTGEPFKRRWIASAGSLSGKFHFQLESEHDAIWQEVDLTPIARQLADDCCAVTISGFLKVEGFGSVDYGIGNPCLYLHRTTRTGGYDGFLNGPAMGYSKEWEPRKSQEWTLGSDTRSLTITLVRWDVHSVWPRITAHFDDISLVVHPRGQPPKEMLLPAERELPGDQRESSASPGR